MEHVSASEQPQQLLRRGFLLKSLTSIQTITTARIMKTTMYCQSWDCMFLSFFTLFLTFYLVSVPIFLFDVSAMTLRVISPIMAFNCSTNSEAL